MIFFIPDTAIEVPLRGLRWHDYDLYSCYTELTPRQVSKIRKLGGKLVIHDTCGFLTTAWLEEINGATVLTALGHVSSNNTITRGRRLI